jgi:hypothetical protein
MRACVSIAVFMLRTTQISTIWVGVYEPGWAMWDISSHVISAHNLGFPIKFGTAHRELTPNSNNPHQKPRSIKKFLRFHIPALWCRPISGWTAPSISRFTYSQLCNGPSLELLVSCRQASLESITDARPPKVMPMVGAFWSCSHVYSWVSLRLPTSHRPWSHSQTHTGVFLKYTLQGGILLLIDLKTH